MPSLRTTLFAIAASLLALVLLINGIVGARTPGSSSSTSTDDYRGTPLGGEVAQDFRLTDQRGQTVGLADFRGKVVVLAFLAPECTDVCPLTAAEFMKANDALQRQAEQVVFLAVNANPQMATVADVAEASRKWGIEGLPNWHYLTGGPVELQGIWKAYNIFAGAPKASKPQETEHSSGVYVIDKGGRLSWYISVPFGVEGFRSLSETLVERIRELL